MTTHSSPKRFVPLWAGSTCGRGFACVDSPLTPTSMTSTSTSRGKTTTTNKAGSSSPSPSPDDDDDIAAAAAVAVIADNDIPPVEEVLRWREFRRQHRTPTPRSTRTTTTTTATATTTTAEVIDPMGFPIPGEGSIDSSKVREFFSTLDCSVNAIRRAGVEKGGRMGGMGGASGEEGEVGEVEEEEERAPTEIMSNTARRLVDVANEEARGMMMLDEEEEGGGGGGGGGDEEKDDDDDCGGGGEEEGETNTTTPPKIYHPSPRGSMTTATSTPTTTITPGWDNTRTTVSNDLLAGVLATPGEKDDDDEDASSPNVVPPPPLSSSSGEEDGVGKEDEEEDVAAEDVVLSYSLSSAIAREDEEEDDDDAVQTLEEVDNFMTQLRKMRDGASPAPAAVPRRRRARVGGRTTAARDISSPPTAAGREEANVELERSLSERRERLKLRKSEDERRKRAFDDRVRAIRGGMDGSCASATGRGGDGSRDGEDAAPRPDATASARTKRGDGKEDEDDQSFPTDALVEGIPARAERGIGDVSTHHHSVARIDSTPAKIASRGEEECHPTDERRDNERRSRTEAQDGPTLPSSVPFVPGARWGGGCARWNPPPRADFVPSGPTSQPRQAGEKKKMNIAVDEDDFSFKPPSIVGASKCGGGGVVRMNNIAISPIVAGGEASSRFVFDRSPYEAGRVKNSVAKILATMADAAQRGTTSSSPISRMSASPASSKLRSHHGMSPSKCKSSLAGAEGESLAVVPARDDDNIFSSSTPRNDASVRNPSPPDGIPLPIPESPKNYSFENAPNEPPSESSFPTGASSSASPDISEGDKGGGIGFGYSAFHIVRGDKSIVTTSSSKHVELGQKNAAQDPPEEEEAENDESTASDGEPSLLGVTVVGSKKKRKTKDKRRRLSSPLFETVQEQESMCSANETEILGESARKQLDPDGFDWKELDAKRNEEDASALIDQGLQRRLSVLALDIVPGLKKEEVDVAIGRATNCSAPPMEGGATVATEGRTDPSLGLRIDIAPENENEEFETVMTCNNPRERDKSQYHATKEESDIMNETAFFTPRSVQSDTSRFRGGKITRVHELRSRFESSGSVASLKDSSKRALSSTRQDKSISIKDSTKNVTSPPPKSAQVTEAPQVTSEEEEQDFDWSLTKSTDSMSIKERRLIFETGIATPECSSSLIRGSSSLIKESTLIGSGVYLKNREIQAMSSLGCETLHTTEASVNDGTVGGQSLDTKKVLRYVKALEQRGNQEADEFESILSFENSIEKKDTGNSTKENNSKREVVGAYTDDNTANCDLNFADFSPVKTRKEAFESKKDQPALARTVAQAHQQLLKKKSEIKEKQSLERKKDANGASPVKRIVSSATTSSHVDILATSVKDKIAIYSGEEASPIKGLSKGQNKAAPRQLSSPNKPSALLQQQSKNSVMRGPSRVAVPQQHQTTSPPRTIAMNRRTETPSPLWVGKQSDTLTYSPNPNISSNPFCGNNPSPNLRPHDFSHVLISRPSPVRFPASSSLHMRQVTTRNEANRIEGRPAPVQTRYDSPFARECDDDEEDGITLSPTFSEVSGLTIPTCVGTFHGPSSQALTRPNQFNMHRNETLFHETMSPIARHRQQKEIALLTGGAKISSHPYLQRLSAKFPSVSTEKFISNVDSADFHDEIKTPKARGSPGVGQGIPPTLRREQLVSQVQASPRNPTSNPTHPKATRNGNSSKSYPSKARRHEWQERNVITENHVKSSNHQKKANGRVAESVEKVNRRMKVSKKSNQQIPNESPYRRSGNHWGAQNENQGDSLKTLDCIRVD